MSDENDVKTKADFEEEREGQNHPGKLPDEGGVPAEATPGGGGDLDSAAIGDGPSGGATTGGDTSNGDSAATGSGPSGGA